MPKATTMGGAVHRPATLSLTRSSLIAEAAKVLRDQIRAGTWVGTLPGERRLCEMLMISRPTLRSALAILEKEEIIDVAQGKLRTIRPQKKRLSSRQAERKEVAILCPDPPLRMHPTTLYLIDETYSRMQKAGYTLSIHSPGWLNFGRPEKYLERHIAENPSTSWALFSVGEAVQKWFSHHPIRAIVSGTCYPEVRIPNIDLDTRAATMHAVGMFLRHGYRQISLLIPESSRPGHIVIHEAFNAAIRQSRHAGTTGRILRVSPNRSRFERQLKDHLDIRSSCQALLITQPMDTLYAMTYLLREKVALGRRVAIISNGDELFFDHLTPSPARYSTNRQKFAAKFCRLLLQLAQSDTLPVKSTLISVDFHPGRTLQDAEIIAADC